MSAVREYKPLKGRSAIVTGSGQNIGKAIALELASQGANVTICGHTNRANAEAVAAEARSLGVGALAILLDIGDSAAVAAMVDETVKAFGSVDIAVANAAVRPHQPFFDISVEDWQRVLNTNLSSAFYLARAALPHMCRRKWGRVIHISGRDGTTGMSNRAHNVTCKAGLHGFSKAIAVEFGGQGITANTIAPGVTDTVRKPENYPNFEAQTKLWLQSMPIGRIGRAEDIAHACAFLASDAAEAITGQLLHLSGGLVMS